MRNNMERMEGDNIKHWTVWQFDTSKNQMDEGAIATHVGFSTNLTVGWDAMVVIKNHPVSKLLGGGGRHCKLNGLLK